ncbi:alpha-1,2-fucosyltransferase [Allorhodopirellula solitaria]|uniref:Glycosyl transferase family 11 n=1 Tax=Allorhodopirellula solitaria TaxID=2527987 RepID=A0A5C5X0X7_9BACT|nr:alpha-1,2-fucosyltransferase [Allorhodopirellula solitaria]TWT56460.1 Glycosyl transferase family 11 [Allorhodopirellula solitaria]
MITFSRLGQHGRLGNQLFQIASVLSVGAAVGQDVVFPEWPYAQYFSAAFPVGSVTNAKTYVERQFSHHVLPVAQGNWDLIGYFQSEKYFNTDLVKRQFRFTDDLSRALSARVERSRRRRVLLSVRRGDFVNNWKYFQLGKDYYLEALSSLDHDVEVFATSDDLDYCRHAFDGLGFVFADGLTAIEQLCLGASCDDFIISNSTFSWWQAWLGEQSGSRVIRPLRNFSDACEEDETDYWPLRWTMFST